MAPVIAAIVLALAGLAVAVIALRRAGPPLPPELTLEELAEARADLHRMFGGKP